MAVTSITQPGIHNFSDKKNDAAEGKRHQTAGANRKQNGYKQKTQWLETENSMVGNMVFDIRKILTTMPNTRIFATKQVIGHK